MKAVIIGCGLIARSHANTIQKNEDAQLVAVCDVDPIKAKTLATEFGVEAFTDAAEMLEKVKPDFAVISVPTFLHEEYVALCSKLGIHVLCEKPLERNFSKAKKLVDAVKSSGIIFMTAQVVRFWPGYIEIKKMYDSGEIGQIRMLHLRRVTSRDESYSKWLFDPELGGGAMHDMLVHDIDYLRYLGGEFKFGYANAVKDETGCYNNVIANVVQKSGIHSISEVSFNMQEGYPFSFSVKIVGTKQTIEYEYSAGATIADRSSSKCQMKIWSKGNPVQDLAIDSTIDAYQTQMDYFVACLKNSKQPEIITPDESLDVIRMIDALHKSADENAIVYLD